MVTTRSPYTGDHSRFYKILELLSSKFWENSDEFLSKCLDNKAEKDTILERLGN
jgi:hypothetical protein